MVDRRRLLTIGMVFVFAASGCSKKSSSPTAPQLNAPPPFPSVNFKGPNTTSTDQHAEYVVSHTGYAQQSTSASLFASFSAIESKQNSSSWTWVDTSQSLIKTFTETQEADGSVRWSCVQNGSDGTYTYDNYLIFAGIRSADGKGGDWKYCAGDTTNVGTDFVWSTTSGGVLTLTMTDYYSGGAVEDSTVFINNSDNSGEMIGYTGSVATFKATWVASGSGEWWTFDNTGTQTGSGYWT